MPHFELSHSAPRTSRRSELVSRAGTSLRDSRMMGSMTREVLIRAATLADVEAMRAIYAPMVTDTAMSFEESPPDAPEIIRRMLASPRRPWLVADVRDHVAGFAYASAHRQRPAYRWSADSSVYVDPHYQGQGLGRLLYERLINEVRDLGYVSLFAGIALPNDASVALHEAIGFRTVGVFRDVGYKRGAWRDVGWWHKTLASPPTHPGDPREWLPAP